MNKYTKEALTFLKDDLLFKTQYQPYMAKAYLTDMLEDENIDFIDWETIDKVDFKYIEKQFKR